MGEYDVNTSVELFTGEIARRIRRQIDKGKNPAELWDVVGERLAESIDYNFEAGGRPDPWPPLSESTMFAVAGRYRVKRKRRGVFDLHMRTAAARRVAKKRILVRQGRLRRSIDYKASGNEFVIGTNLVYGAIHQFGGETGRMTGRFDMPARPYLVLQDEDRDGILDRDVPRFLEVD